MAGKRYCGILVFHVEEPAAPIIHPNFTFSSLYIVEQVVQGFSNISQIKEVPNTKHFLNCVESHQRHTAQSLFPRNPTEDIFPQYKVG